MILSRCNFKYAGLLTGEDFRTRAVFDMTGFDLASVQLELVDGAWGSGVVKVQYATDPNGPYYDFASAKSFTANGTTGILAIPARYIVVVVGTGTGTDAYLDILVSPRKTTAGTAGTA